MKKARVVGAAGASFEVGCRWRSSERLDKSVAEAQELDCSQERQAENGHYGGAVTRPP